jgi:hypothetical protein
MKTWLLGLATAGLVLTNIAAADDKVPTIEEIMTKVNKGKDALHRGIGESLKAGTVQWDKVQKNAKDYANLAEFLGKNDPPQGDKASWTKHTKAYAADAKSLSIAVQKMDKTAATAVHGKLSKSCMGCHKVHRPE